MKEQAVNCVEYCSCPDQPADFLQDDGCFNVHRQADASRVLKILLGAYGISNFNGDNYFKFLVMYWVALWSFEAVAQVYHSIGSTLKPTPFTLYPKP